MRIPAVIVLAMLVTGCGGGSGGGGTTSPVFTSLTVTSNSDAYEYGPVDTLRLIAEDQNGLAMSTGTAIPVWTVTPSSSASVDPNNILVVTPGQGSGSVTVTARLTMQGIAHTSNTVSVALRLAPATQSVVAPSGQLVFSPSSVHILVGGAVSWSGLSALHNVHFSSITPFNSGTSASNGAPGSSNTAIATFTSTVSGTTYSYVCDQHPGMTGAVTVH